MRAVPLEQRYRFLCPLVVTEKPGAKGTPVGRKSKPGQSETLSL
jgi:hypothetical protein